MKKMNYINEPIELYGNSLLDTRIVVNISRSDIDQCAARNDPFNKLIVIFYAPKAIQRIRRKAKQDVICSGCAPCIFCDISFFGEQLLCLLESKQMAIMNLICKRHMTVGEDPMGISATLPVQKFYRSNTYLPLQRQLLIYQIVPNITSYKVQQVNQIRFCQFLKNYLCLDPT